MKSKLMDRLNSTVKEMSEAVKHLESSDLQKARQWRKDLKILKKKYEKSQSDYLYGGIDEESGLFENDAENIVRNQIGTLQRANRNLMEAQDYGEKTNEELFRIKEKFKGINQKVIFLFKQIIEQRTCRRSRQG